MIQAAGILLTGAAAGAFGTLLGLGGGVFVVPVLVLAFRVPMHAAVGASLVAIVATSSAGASKNVALGLANMRLGLSLETMTVLGALCGGLLAPHLGARLLIALFAALLLAVSAMLWRSGPAQAEEGGSPLSGPGLLGGTYQDPASGKDVSYSVERLPAVLAASYGAGVVSALLGVGGGLVKVPALRLLSKVPMKAATATSNFMIGVTAATSAVLYLGRGDVPMPVVGPVVLGVLLGARAGLALSRALSDRATARIFAFVTLAMAAQMVRRALAG